MKLKYILNILEEFAPSGISESFDNVGLLVGTPDDEINGIIISLDITEELIEEAINNNCNLIVSHHPIIISGIKKFNGNNYTERCIIKAIKNNISIYSGHTNVDSTSGGVNSKIADILKLNNRKVLAPQKNKLLKLVTYVPSSDADIVRNALFNAGAGHIGNYDSCSFNIKGEGTFKANENSNPSIGNIGELHTEQEIRLETVLPDYKKNKVLQALLSSHPYEEVAYDIYHIQNEWSSIGLGMVGDLENPMSENDFLHLLKEKFKVGCIKHTKQLNKPIKKVALCGGSGSSLLQNAIKSGADIFVSGDFKYHQFFDAENKIIIADIGHFESEQFTKDVFYDLLTKNLPNFAVRLAKTNTNPINYL